MFILIQSEKVRKPYFIELYCCAPWVGAVSPTLVFVPVFFLYAYTKTSGDMTQYNLKGNISLIILRITKEAHLLEFKLIKINDGKENCCCVPNL